jgi:hypothetical protein
VTPSSHDAGVLSVIDGRLEVESSTDYVSLDEPRTEARRDDDAASSAVVSRGEMCARRVEGFVTVTLAG